ncbi:hypothetical protein [Cesiribacter andamanensis]|uniref:DUF3575 domain-containing protein n=1 Tax=Cesiribacter andamanensis AMV16 TaxID=1279009 RepID=M7N0T6_9BACT|nr:hypothetical protein [Cesiribacter andamanensis]EMR00927.1 hypothetical protein ADICEAN_03956 [Cesiribacter andamanensis AMV16]
MKKIALITLLVGLCLAMLPAQAQRYMKKDIILNAGTSFFLINLDPSNGYAEHSSIPPLTLNVEFGLSNEFALGPYIGYFGRSYKNPGFTDRFGVYSFGARGTYHAVNLLNDLFYTGLDEERIDIYATFILGYELYRWSFEDPNRDDGIKASDGGLVFGPLLGIRFYPGKNKRLAFLPRGGAVPLVMLLPALRLALSRGTAGKPCICC